MHRAKIIGVIALKGGVGKTTVATNLGSVLANKFDKQVLIVDGNFSTPHLGLTLGLSNPQVTLHDVLKNKASIFDALYQHESGFYVIPGSLNPPKVNPMSLKKNLLKLAPYYDYIIIDSSPSLNQEMLGTMYAADELFVVTSTDYPTLSSTIHAVKIAKEKKTPITGLIINKARNKKFELSTDEIESTTGVPVLSTLPDDVVIPEAIAYSTPIILYSPKKKIAKEYHRLGSFISGEEYIDGSLLGKTKVIFVNNFSNMRDKFSTMKNKVSNIKLKGR